MAEAVPYFAARCSGQWTGRNAQVVFSILAFELPVRGLVRSSGTVVASVLWGLSKATNVTKTCVYYSHPKTLFQSGDQPNPPRILFTTTRSKKIGSYVVLLMNMTFPFSDHRKSSRFFRVVNTYIYGLTTQKAVIFIVTTRHHNLNSHPSTYLHFVSLSSPPQAFMA